MKDDKHLETLLDKYSDHIKNGEDIIVLLKDRVLFFEMGDNQKSPIIKVESFEDILDLTIDELLDEMSELNE